MTLGKLLDLSVPPVFLTYKVGIKKTIHVSLGQTEKDKYQMISLTVEPKKGSVNEFLYKQKQNFRWRKHIYSYQGVRQEDTLEDCGWHIRTAKYTA